MPEHSNDFAQRIINNNYEKRKAIRETVGSLKVTLEDLRDTLDGLQSAVDTAEHELRAFENLVDDLEQLI